MNRLVCFLMVGLAFTVLQISTVAAQAPTPPPADTFAQPPADPMGDAPGGPPMGEDCANKPTPEETAACWDQQGGHMDHPGDHPGGPPTGAAPGGPPMGDANMPPAGQ